MKKQLPLFVLSLAILGLFVSMNFDEETRTKNRNFIFSMFNEDPVLPETAFPYSDITFPSHFNSDSTETGYDGEVDTTILDFLSDDKSTLGRVLFYDKKLSAMENMSCGSCHKQEFSFAEDKDFSEGITTLTARNSLQLNDLGWTNKDGFFWDMSFSNLEDMISLPLKDPNEVGAVMEDVVVKMYSTSYYADLFEKAYGDDDITEERIIESITHFISSMTTFNSRFDQEAVNDFNGFTEKELDGLEVFKANCSICHKEGPIFFGQEIGNEVVLEMPFFFNNGLETDPIDIGAGSWAEGMDGLYKLPTLRNIALTAPYMHDGRFATLDDVIDFYSEDVVETEWNEFVPVGGFQFTSSERSSLKAFLETLTDETFLTDEKWSDPFSAIVAVPEIETIEMSISPNPMSTYALIEIENDYNDEFKVELFNEVGQLVKADKFNGTSYQLDKNTLIPGLYNIRLTSTNKQKSIKLIVQ